MFLTQKKLQRIIFAAKPSCIIFVIPVTNVDLSQILKNFDYLPRFTALRPPVTGKRLPINCLLKYFKYDILLILFRQYLYGNYRLFVYLFLLQTHIHNYPYLFYFSFFRDIEILYPYRFSVLFKYTAIYLSSIYNIPC